MPIAISNSAALKAVRRSAESPLKRERSLNACCQNGDSCRAACAAPGPARITAISVANKIRHGVFQTKTFTDENMISI
jgi:hypothetical protein